MWQNFKTWQKIAAVSVPILGIFITGMGNGWFGGRQSNGNIVTSPRPLVSEIEKGENKQILFGDLHVHTTYSVDAFTLSLPLTGGEGTHPPADACDYARFCSSLDFWSINDHAEGLTPFFWKQTKEAVRQCNAVSGSAENPDMVTYLGWEWTQVGTVPSNHYGHKNVILLETDDEKVPARPIASAPPPGSALEALQNPTTFWQRTGIGLASPFAPGQKPSAYLSATTFFSDIAARRQCDMSVPTRELPDDCLERTHKPDELFNRLKAWNTETIVIPHGTTWGFYTPAASNWSKQLAGNMHSEEFQLLFEIFSGHGNSEEFRPFVAAQKQENGRYTCTEPNHNYTPSCYRAGEFIKKRCLEKNIAKDICEKRAAEARQNYVDAGIPGHLTVPGARPADWLDAGQCRDCYLPAFNYRPGGSAQYILATGNFDDNDSKRPRRFQFGFMASSDNHFARPGTGYKEDKRRGFTESIVTNTELLKGIIPSPSRDPVAESRPFNAATAKIHRLFYIEAERQASFFTTGGLVAVHSAGRDRTSIWKAMKNKEVYGTAGERILLWFDLQNAENEKASMGSVVSMKQNPRFSVRAVGSFKQKPGCPAHSLSAMGPEKIDRLCKGECYNPSDERHLVNRIEIIRVLPQTYQNEPVKDLVEDPYLVYKCPATRSGCTFQFTDSTFASKGRDAVYYARVIQESHPVINGAQLNCEYDDSGKCVKTRPCNAESDDNCMAERPELAWSSPIYVNHGSIK